MTLCVRSMRQLLSLTTILMHAHFAALSVRPRLQHGQPEQFSGLAQ